MEPIINSQLPEFKVQAFQNGSFKTVSHDERNRILFRNRKLFQTSVRIKARTAAIHTAGLFWRCVTIHVVMDPCGLCVLAGEGAVCNSCGFNAVC